MAVRIATWNINSVRIRLAALARLIAEQSPDIICLQETKAQDQDFPLAFFAEEQGYAHNLVRGMKSYNGVAILSRLKLTEMATSDWCGRADCRHIAARVAAPGGSFEVHNFYVPSGGDVPDPDENDKFAHKLAFLDEMRLWAGKLKKGRRVLVGDLNVAPLETDVWSHTQLLDVVSHTPIEVKKLTAVADAHGWIDAARQFVPADVKLYSWWSYRARDWELSDRGRRLDHIWVSPQLKGNLTGAHIVRQARGWEKTSDHVPVIADLEI